MGFFNRLANVAKGAVDVKVQEWSEGGGLQDRLERLAETARTTGDTSAAAGSGAGASSTDRVALIDEAYKAGILTKAEWRTKRAAAVAGAPPAATGGSALDSVASTAAPRPEDTDLLRTLDPAITDEEDADADGFIDADPIEVERTL